MLNARISHKQEFAKLGKMRKVGRTSAEFLEYRNKTVKKVNRAKVGEIAQVRFLVEQPTISVKTKTQNEKAKRNPRV